MAKNQPKRKYKKAIGCLGIVILVVLICYSCGGYYYNNRYYNYYGTYRETYSDSDIRLINGEIEPVVFRFVIDTRFEVSDGYKGIGGTGSHVELQIGYDKHNEFTIDWGDGSPIASIAKIGESSRMAKRQDQQDFDEIRKHDYRKADLYTITLNGIIPGGIRFGYHHDFVSNGEYRLIEVIDPLPYTIKENIHDDMFAGCTNLVRIPSGLFDNYTECTGFVNLFRGCRSLAGIPAGLFDSNENVKSFSCAFIWCESLTSVPPGLFAKTVLVNNFHSVFNGCSKLESIPAGLFDKNTSVVNYKEFLNVTGFASAFSNCESLKGIPSGLFDNNPLVTSFYGTFQDCKSLTSIPAGLFDKNVLVTTFERTFEGCRNLEYIPDGLFDNNTLVTTFYYVFKGCSKKIIPDDIFRNNPLAGDSISYAF